MDETTCRASALWEDIRSDGFFDIGGGGTGDTDEGGCDKARRESVVLELVGRRALLSPGGLLEGCSMDTFTVTNTSSCSSLWVFLAFLKMPCVCTTRG